MPKEEWGVKRLCPTTGKRFYDLGRDPIVSPYTGEVVEIDTGKKSSLALKTKSAEATAKESAVDDDDVVDVEVLDDDDTDVDLGDDVLEDDDDDDTVPLEEIADVASDDDDS
ncbi:TIGR02300 family protein [Alphaproteobacteria bacterium KMM 3653]|uniref:TIGR02300 family protein n=1 Tax=Harenicola maris TaxID=2841044 RepID=A0AAP2G8L9_9RHOB|nr:TIGR02300 family protein [Harenicola maris]